MKKNNRVEFMLQALFVVFLWSATRIIMKLGLEEISPYIFATMIQLVAATAIGIYFWFNKHRFKYRPSRKDIGLMILNGIVAVGAANLFGVIGLQYVTGATAGLLSVGSLLFAIPFAYLVLRERPKWMELMGVAVVVGGVYVFMSGHLLAGTLFGIALLLLAESGYAFSDVLTRLVAKAPGDESPTIALVSNVVGLAVIAPIGLLVDGVPVNLFTNWPIIMMIVVVGLIFGFSGLLWSAVLNRLEVFEVSLVSNTMIVQVAILSVIFLHETLTTGNIWGITLVVIGTLIADNRFAVPLHWRAKLGMV